MFGQLFESRGRTQRRSGGATLSIVAHTVVIAAAAVATASGKSAPSEKAQVIAVRFTPPARPAPTVPPQRSTAAPRSPNSPTPSISIVMIDVPTIVPTSLPSIDLSHGTTSADSIVIGSSATGTRNNLSGAGGLLTDAPGDGEWRGNELLMRIVSSAKPRYPESLRQAGIDGRVLVRFTVDTLGAVDMSSLQVLSSTHDLFTRAVRDALGSFRFKPSEVRGKRVRSLAEMPFEFAISR